MNTTFQVYNVGDDEHPVVARSASRVLTKAISSKVDLTGAATSLFAPVTALASRQREEDYDPHKHRNVPHPTSYSETMMHLTKAIFGAGFLALPNAMSRMGFVVGLIGIAILGFFSCYCLQLLIISQYFLSKKKRVGYMSYPDSMRIALQEGPPCLRWTAGFFAGSVDFIIIIWQLGVSSVYLVFVGRNVGQVMQAYGTDLNIRILILCQYPVLATIGMIKDLKKLTLVSTFSNFCNFLGIVLVFYYLSEEDLEVDASYYEVKSLEDVPIFIGMVLFAIMAPGVILALEHNMANPKDFTGWCGLFTLGSAVITTIYAAMGTFGYMKYGTDCKGSITLSLPATEKKAHVAKIAFAATIYTSFPLQNFAAWQTCWSLIKHRFNESVTADMALRLLMTSIPFAAALAMPALGPLISLMGSLCLTLVGVLFPALVHCSISYPNNYGVASWKLISDILIMISGIFCCISGVYSSLLEIRDEI